MGLDGFEAAEGAEPDHYFDLVCASARRARKSVVGDVGADVGARVVAEVS